MTIETLNTIMDSMVRGTIAGICLCFWLFGLAAVWKWFLGILKKFFKFLCPKLYEKLSTKFTKKKGSEKDEENTHTEH